MFAFSTGRRGAQNGDALRVASHPAIPQFTSVEFYREVGRIFHPSGLRFGYAATTGAVKIVLSGRATTMTGRRTVKVAPLPGALFTATSPPIS